MKNRVDHCACPPDHPAHQPCDHRGFATWHVWSFNPRMKRNEQTCTRCGTVIGWIGAESPRFWHLSDKQTG